MSEPIKPTVGRIVYWYETKPVVGGFATLGPHAAIITAVHSDNCINVAVHNQNGSGTFGRTSVKLLAPGEARPFHGNNEHWCEWMPYQIGQAKNAEFNKHLLATMQGGTYQQPHAEMAARADVAIRQTAGIAEAAMSAVDVGKSDGTSHRRETKLRTLPEALADAMRTLDTAMQRMHEAKTDVEHALKVVQSLKFN